MTRPCARSSIATARNLLGFGLIALLSVPSAAQEAKKPNADRAPPRHKFEVWSVAVSRDGKVLAGSGGMWDHPGEIGIWDLATGQPLQRFTEGLGVGSIAFSPDGKLLASGSWTGHVRVRDWATARQLADFPVKGMTRLAFSPDGTLLAGVTEKATAQLWDVKRRQLVADLEGDLFRFHCVVFSPDGKRLLAGGGDWKPGGIDQVTIWDVATRKQVAKLVGHEDAIICMTFSPDGKTIATGGIDRSIRLWDTDTAKELKVLRGHRHWVESLAYTADGKTLVSGSHDYSVRFWDVEQGKETNLISLPGSVRVVQFTPDGQNLIVGGGPKLLKILDATGQKELTVLWDGTNPQKAAMDEMPVGRPLQVKAGEVPVEPVELPEPPQETRWRLWLALGIAGLLVLGLLVGLAIHLRQRRRATTGPPMATTPTSRLRRDARQV